MQTPHDFHLDTYENISEVSLKNIVFPLFPGDRIFFIWDLGAGKTTFIRTLLKKYFDGDSLIIRSPTYMYYQKYGENIYHFDLYRIENPEDLLFLGITEILEDPDTICLIEWPEILGESIIPTKRITIESLSEKLRKISIHSYHHREATE